MQRGFVKADHEESDWFIAREIFYDTTDADFGIGASLDEDVIALWQVERQGRAILRERGLIQFGFLNLNKSFRADAHIGELIVNGIILPAI